MKNILKFLIPVPMIAVAIALVVNLTGCTAAQQLSATTTAEQFATNAQAYAETLANMIQTINTGIQTTAPLINGIAAEWGVTPTNNQQLAIYNQVVGDSAKVSGDAAKVNQVLSTINLAKIVASSVPTTAPATSFIVSTNPFLIAACIRPEYGSVAKDSTFDLHVARKS